MIFALGFLCAGLLTLLFLPVFWRRALRLSRRRLEMQMPLSMTEIVAERDQLRAEFAMERRKIEQRYEALHDTRARDLSELGRRAAALVSVGEERDALRSAAAALRDDLGEAQRRAREAEGELAAALKEAFDATGLAERRGRMLANLQFAHAELENLADERRAAIAGLEAQSEGLRAQLADAEEALSRAQMRLAEKVSAVDLLQRERDYALIDVAAGSAKRDSMQAAIDALNARLAEQDNVVRAAQRERQRSAREAEDLGKSLESALEQEHALRASAERQTLAAREEARAQAERLQALRAERDSLEGALAAARREAESLREQMAARAPASPEGRKGAEDALLRQAIADVGAEVMRLAGALEHNDAVDPAAPPAERMRELQSAAGRAARSA